MYFTLGSTDGYLSVFQMHFKHFFSLQFSSFPLIDIKDIFSILCLALSHSFLFNVDSLHFLLLRSIKLKI